MVLRKVLYIFFNVLWTYGVVRDLILLMGLLGHLSSFHAVLAVAYVFVILTIFNAWGLISRSYLEITISLEKRRESTPTKIIRSFLLVSKRHPLILYQLCDVIVVTTPPHTNTNMQLALYFLWLSHVHVSNHFTVLSVFAQILIIRIVTEIGLYNGPAFKRYVPSLEVG